MPVYCDVYSLPASVTIVSIAASVAATCALLHTLQNDLVPVLFLACLKKLRARLSSRLTVVVEQSLPDGLSPNPVYDAVDTYLSGQLPPSIRRIKVSKLEEDHHHLSVSVDKDQDVPDIFRSGGVFIDLNWVSRSTPVEHCDGKKPKPNKTTELKQYFELSFLKEHRETVLNDYLKYVQDKAKEIKEKRRGVEE